MDTTEAERIEGIEVVRDGDLVTVLHELPDMADMALSKVKAEYTENDPDVNHLNIFEHLVNSVTDRRTVDEGGDLKTGEEQSTQVFESEYPGWIQSTCSHRESYGHSRYGRREHEDMGIHTNPFPPKRAGC